VNLLLCLCYKNGHDLIVEIGGHDEEEEGKGVPHTLVRGIKHQQLVPIPGHQLAHPAGLVDEQEAVSLRVCFRNKKKNYKFTYWNLYLLFTFTLMKYQLIYLINQFTKIIS